MRPATIFLITLLKLKRLITQVKIRDMKKRVPKKEKKVVT